MAKAWAPDQLARNVFWIVVVGISLEILAMVVIGF